MLTSALLAGILSGAGGGIMLKSLGSAGGTDILSVALLKRFSLGLGNTALAFNCLVLLAGGLATSPHGNGLCRLLGFGSTWE